METIDYNLVKQRFKKSYASYTQNAYIQKEVENTLFDLFANYNSIPVNRIFEIGCGSGNLASRILNIDSVKNLYLNDLDSIFFEEILKKFKGNQHKTTFIEGDVLAIDFPKDLDCVLSSSVFQWITDLNGLFSRILASLKPSGYLFFSTYGTQNFTEIKQLLNVGINYPSKEKIVEKLSPNFEILSCLEEERVEYFDTAYDVLKHIKLTGVNSLKNYQFNRKILHDFDLNYVRHFSCNTGVSLTYHPMFFVCRKKTQ